MEGRDFGQSLENALLIIERALKQDFEDNLPSEAQNPYMEAISLLLILSKETKNQKIRRLLGDITSKCIERAESLKKIVQSDKNSQQMENSSIQPAAVSFTKKISQFFFPSQNSTNSPMKESPSGPLMTTNEVANDQQTLEKQDQQKKMPGLDFGDIFSSSPPKIFTEEPPPQGVERSHSLLVDTSSENEFENFSNFAKKRISLQVNSNFAKNQKNAVLIGASPTKDKIISPKFSSILKTEDDNLVKNGKIENFYLNLTQICSEMSLEDEMNEKWSEAFKWALLEAEKMIVLAKKNPIYQEIAQKSLGKAQDLKNHVHSPQIASFLSSQNNSLHISKFDSNSPIISSPLKFGVSQKIPSPHSANSNPSSSSSSPSTPSPVSPFLNPNIPFNSSSPSTQKAFQQNSMIFSQTMPISSKISPSAASPFFQTFSPTKIFKDLGNPQQSFVVSSTKSHTPHSNFTNLLNPNATIPEKQERRKNKRKTIEKIEFLEEILNDEKKRKFLFEKYPGFFNNMKGFSFSSQEKPILTSREISLLRETSVVNKKLFLPFSIEKDTKNSEFFKLQMHVDKKTHQQICTLNFLDPDGFLSLSPEQMKYFFDWRRPSELFEQATSKKIVIVGSNSISADSVSQSIISDCSFVASLTVVANYECRFERQLITSRIYPQDETTKKPIYNPTGKYVVKILVNGVNRKVVIDDLFPVSKKNEILCAHSSSFYNNNSNPNPEEFELWVSLVEKAFMKVNGGYNFPGSNSGCDLYMLIGWIPQDIFLQQQHQNQKEVVIFEEKEKKAKMEKVWAKIFRDFLKGHCLMTVSTGDNLSKKDYEEAGLEKSHAYALLDLKFDSKTEEKMAQLKNPWNIPENQKISNSPKTPNNSEQENTKFGTFWVKFSFIWQFFEVIHVSWNPVVFPFQKTIHEVWEEKERPYNGTDHYNVDKNPQYSISFITSKKWENEARFLEKNEDLTKNEEEEELEQEQDQKQVWVILEKHVTDISKRNDDFFTFHVYKQDELVLCKENPLFEGTYSNNQIFHCGIHEFYSFSSKQTKEIENLIFVVSQMNEIQKMYYTLKVFSTIPFKISRIPSSLRNFSQILLQKVESFGTCNNPIAFKKNPQLQIEVSPSNSNLAGQKHSILLKLEVPEKEITVNMIVLSCAPIKEKEMCRVTSATKENVITTSGNYRNVFCFCKIPEIESFAKFNVVLSTFYPISELDFHFSAESETCVPKISIL